jgi:predicted dinucleotide-binding enzyme
MQSGTTSVFRQCVLVPLIALLPALAAADRIAIIGTGDVGSALGPEFAALGHEIVYGSRDPSRDSVTALVSRTGGNASATTPAEAVSDADIVLLAVPGRLAVDIVTDLGDLSGKIIIDPTNNYLRDGHARLAVDTSNGEEIQAAVPDAMIVKAFNTLSWRQMVDPASSGGAVTIPLVGNDGAAKARVAEIVAGMDLEPIDLGPIENARHVEGMLVLWIQARMNGTPFDYHLRRSPTQ